MTMVSNKGKSLRVLLASVLTWLMLATVVVPQATAEVFDTITTPGDGWDVTFHPTNQNYAFFSHHRNQYLGCFYRIDPDGAGPLEQGDGCFLSGQNPYALLQAGGSVGQKSSVHVTSDGLTAYMPLNYSADYRGMGKFDISDPDPNNWTAEPNITWDGMQYHSNSIIVDDVIYALNSTGFLLFDTATETGSTVPFSSGPVATNGSLYSAAGKIWTMGGDHHLHCYDPATGALCAHDTWVDGKSVDSAGGFAIGNYLDAVAEYRNTDGSFGGFCAANYNGTQFGCLNAAGDLDTTMVNPLEAHKAAMGTPDWGSASQYGTFEVSRQHQLITHEPLKTTGQDYYCWDYTTQAVCTNFITQTDNEAPGYAYTVRQDAWNDNCFWSNADNRIIGVWDLGNIGTTSCDVVYVPPTTTTTTTVAPTTTTTTTTTTVAPTTTTTTTVAPTTTTTTTTLPPTTVAPSTTTTTTTLTPTTTLPPVTTSAPPTTVPPVVAPPTPPAAPQPESPSFTG